MKKYIIVWLLFFSVFLGIGNAADYTQNHGGSTVANITSGTITGITDLAVADGGTGASTLADGGIVVGNGTSAVEVVAPGATTEILVGGGAATNPVWTTATGSGAPVRATSPTIVTPAIDTINESTPAAGVTIDSVLLKDGGISPLKAKGPAIITTFAGTVTATASTTVTFSSAADAILAGYSATNPIFGTTLISNALTRYIVSWTNATTCVVDSAVTWAGTAITSTQLPIATFVNSANVVQGYIVTSGQIMMLKRDNLAPAYSFIGYPSTGLYIDTSPTIYLTINESPRIAVDSTGTYFFSNTNLRINGASAGTSLLGGAAWKSGTAPTTSPADTAQMWVADRGAVAGDAALHMRDEVGTNGPVAFATQKVITQAATDTLTLNEVMGTVISNYGQAAENTQTLPAAAAGYKGRVSISTTGAGAFHLKAGASDKIYLNGTALDDGDKVTLAAPAVGDYFDFWTIQTAAAAWDWVVVSGVGILIDGGV